MKKKIKNYSGRNFKKKRENDKITKEHRSSLMSKIRSRGTIFEENFVEELKRRTKFKFQQNVQSIKGKPDLVFEKPKVCVFLDSDFWHGWQYPRWKHLLKDDFWREKIEKNRNRDKRTSSYLRKHGWIVIRIWEHSIKNSKAVQLNKINQALLLVKKRLIEEKS